MEALIGRLNEARMTNDCRQARKPASGADRAAVLANVELGNQTIERFVSVQLFNPAIPASTKKVSLFVLNMRFPVLAVAPLAQLFAVAGARPNEEQQRLGLHSSPNAQRVRAE